MMQQETKNLLLVLRLWLHFGGILGTQEITTRASLYRPGTRIFLLVQIQIIAGEQWLYHAWIKTDGHL
jgi:hypothetical protein